MDDYSDQKYYEVANEGTFAGRVLKKARAQIYSDFKAKVDFDAETKILDFGVSNEITDADNVLEREYPYPSAITAVGLGDGAEFKQTYSQVTYQQIEPFEPLPFGENHFDVAVSNAVMEHMQSVENQIWMLKELNRVAKSVLITVPNKYFPVEHHTAIPFLHYHPITFKLACKLLKKEKWLDEKELILISTSSLKKIAKQISSDFEIGYTGLKIGPMSSNLFLLQK